MTSKSLSISIHPKGSGRTTDRVLEGLLRKENPGALLEAQYLLSATTKHLRGPGLFSSSASRLKKVQEVCYRLNKELKKTWTGEEDELTRIEKYLSQVSDTYPNWQAEYEELNRLIPRFF